MVDYAKLARALDDMPQDLTGKEADILETVLKQLKSKKPLSEKQKKALDDMNQKYLATAEDSEVAEKDPDPDEESAEGEDSAVGKDAEE